MAERAVRDRKPDPHTRAPQLIGAARAARKRAGATPAEVLGLRLAIHRHPRQLVQLSAECGSTSQALDWQEPDEGLDYVLFLA